jgi:hypothetical protein
MISGELVDFYVQFSRANVWFLVILIAYRLLYFAWRHCGVGTRTIAAVAVAHLLLRRADIIATQPDHSGILQAVCQFRKDHRAVSPLLAAGFDRICFTLQKDVSRFESAWHLYCLGPFVISKDASPPEWLLASYPPGRMAKLWWIAVHGWMAFAIFVRLRFAQWSEVDPAVCNPKQSHHWKSNWMANQHHCCQLYAHDLKKGHGGATFAYMRPFETTIAFIVILWVVACVMRFRSALPGRRWFDRRLCLWLLAVPTVCEPLFFAGYHGGKHAFWEHLDAQPSEQSWDLLRSLLQQSSMLRALVDETHLLMVTIAWSALLPRTPTMLSLAGQLGGVGFLFHEAFRVRIVQHGRAMVASASASMPGALAPTVAFVFVYLGVALF